MKKIAIVTSGGDAPASTPQSERPFAPQSIKAGKPLAFATAIRGLANDDFLPLGLRDVGGID